MSQLAVTGLTTRATAAAAMVPGDLVKFAVKLSSIFVAIIMLELQ